MADPNGFIARTVIALKYAASGVMPDTWFGPGIPLAPQAPESVRGRQFDFPVGLNFYAAPRTQEATTFAKLALLADNCGPLRMIIERQKDLMAALDWIIKPRLKPSLNAQPDAEAAAIMAFLQSPDGRLDWTQWLRSVLEQLLVFDAVSIYARPTKAGGLFALEVLDGATIKPLLDANGRMPLMPLPAYQQVLKGLPAVDYTAQELLYYPQNVRANRVYGYSRVEQIKDIVEMSIDRMKSQAGYFTHGNIGDGYFTAPEGTVPDQITAMENSWNSLMTASIAGKRQSMFLPSGFEWHATKGDVLQDAFDEWLMRLICFAFGVAPSPFIKQSGLGHGNGKTEQETAEAGGVAPLMQFVVRLMNRLLATRFNRTDLEFAWNEDRETDPKVAADIDDIALKNGSATIDEVRDRTGKGPIPGGDKAYIYTTAGPVAVDGIEQAAADAAQAAKDAADAAKVKADQPTLLAAPGAPAAVPAIDAKGTDPKLAKAAPAKAFKMMRRVIGAYLAEKADEIAPVLADALMGLAKEDPKGRVDAALSGIDWTWDDLPPLTGPILGGIAVAAGKDAVAELGLFDPAVLKLIGARSAAWAEDRAAEMVGRQMVGGVLIDNPDSSWSISETTRTILRGQITAAMENGTTNADLAKSIRESTAFGPDRAEMIARTETATAQVQGEIVGWRESGLVEGRQWLAAPDCCDECQGYDGMIVGIDDEFPQGDAPAHPLCRCDEIPVLTGDMPDAPDDTE